MSDRTDDQAVTIRALLWRLGRAVFGDRAGLALFLGTLCVVTATWRAGVFINDNFTLVWTLEALSEGRAWIAPAGESAYLAPGTNTRAGVIFGRNYGQVVAALPALWLLQAIDAILDLRIALAAAWHLLALAFVVQLGRLSGYRLESQLGGSVLVGTSFLLNAAIAQSFVSVSVYTLALQVTTAVAAALLAVVLYRLVTLRHGRKAGVVAGAAMVLVTPISLWATIPKRHVLGALIAVGVLYAFARSRESNGAVSVPVLGQAPVYRAGAYALIGLWAWVHAAEALFMFVALLAVDIPTAPSNDRRSLAVVAAAFALSLVPLLVTNSIVTGEMLRPPRAMGERGLTAPAQENLTSSGGGDSSGTASGIEGLFGALGAGSVGVVIAQVVSITVEGVASFGNVESLYRTYVASSVEGIQQNKSRFLGINLALLEPAPVLGACIAAVVGGVHAGHERLRATLDATDALAVLFGVGFVLIYNGKLPLNTQVTVRYLLVLYPLGILLLARSATVRGLLNTHRSELVWSYTAGVAVGGQLLVAYLVIGQYAVGEAARIHALLGVVLGIAVAVTSTASAFDERARPVAAVALGLAGAAGTVFFLLATLSHFAFVGEYVLPVAGALSDLLSAVG